MATSGSVSVAATKYDTLKFSWWQNSQSIANNNTEIGWKLELIAASAGYISSSSSKSWSVSVNGTAYSGTNTVGIANNATKTLASGTTTIGHNADGSKSFSFSFSQQFSITFGGASVGTISGSGTGTLDNIPRQATLTAAPDFNDEQNPTITYSNPAGNNVQALQACIASPSGTIYAAYRNISMTSNSYTFSLTTAERTALRKAAANSKTLTVKFIVYTKIGGNDFWSSLSKTLTIINDNVTLSPTVTVTDDLTKSLTGDTEGNTIIKGVSTVNYAINAKAYKEATIAGQWVKNNGAYYSNSTGTITDLQSGYFVFAASDSRGNRDEKEITKGFVNYIKTTCNTDVSIALTSEQLAAITLKVSGNYFNSTFGDVANALWLYYKYKTESGDDSGWIALSPTFNGNTYEATVTIPDLDYKGSYTIQCKAGDRVATAQSAEKVIKAIPVFDWGENDFNFNVPVAIQGNTIADVVTEQGEKDGWTYRKWGSGICECWKILTINTAINTGWGSMVVGDTKMERQNYPFAYASKPVEQATLMCGNNAAWLFAESGGNGVNGGYASAIYNVCRPTAVTATQTFYILLYAKGMEK